MVGIEPTTRALRMRCSTTELHRRRFFGVKVIARVRRCVKRLNRGAPPRLQAVVTKGTRGTHLKSLDALVTPGFTLKSPGRRYACPTISPTHNGLASEAALHGIS
jgi:hypothetical protein